MAAFTEEQREAAFWAKAKRADDDGCWEFQGGRSKTGYGYFGVGYPKTMLAHRYAWTVTNGPIPDGMNVCHKCDNPPCVRPTHLFLETPTGNHADKVAKGRQAKGEPVTNRGESAGLAKLTEATVLEIRRLYAEGVPQIELAPRFGITQGNISKIVLRKSWSHI